MKVFTSSLTVAAIAASVAAKKGKMFEANAFVTPKREIANSDLPDPYLQQNLLNLRQAEMDEYLNGGIGHDIIRTIVTGGAEDTNTHIVSTSDIDNYFNLQITTTLYFGSNQEPHQLILDTGSMVSSHQTHLCRQKKVVAQPHLL
jgi:hypothetical protein